MKKKYISFLLLLLFSCSEKKVEDILPSIIYKELNNKDIESAVIEYQAIIEAENSKFVQKGDSVYVGVYMRNINDSMKRVVLNPIIDFYSIKFNPSFFICNINKKDVFIFPEGMDPYYFGNNFFGLSEKNLWLYIKRYFPNRYKQYVKDGHFSNSRTYHPELCHLTFLKDSLIDKTYQRGSTRDKVKITINGKEDWY